MIKIFAKLGTDEKVAIACRNEETSAVQMSLHREFGGRWVWVDSPKTMEVLIFNDGLTYHGFDKTLDRHCKAIKQLTTTTNPRR